MSLHFASCIELFMKITNWDVYWAIKHFSIVGGCLTCTIATKERKDRRAAQLKNVLFYSKIKNSNQQKIWTAQATHRYVFLSTYAHCNDRVNDHFQVNSESIIYITSMQKIELWQLQGEQLFPE